MGLRRGCCCLVQRLGYQDRFVFVSIFLLFIHPVHAQETSFKEQFLETNHAVAEWFDGVADGLDLFLVGRKLTDRANESYLRVENITYFTENSEPLNVSGFNASVRLPNFEEYWQLIFETSDEQTENRRSGSDYLKQTPRERNVGASLGIFRNLGQVRFAVQPRIKLKDPLSLTHTMKIESLIPHGEYTYHPKTEFFADADRGVGTFMAININRLLSPIHSLTLINEAEYLEKKHELRVSNGFSIGQILSPVSTFAYGMLFNSINRPNYNLDNYALSATATYLIYERILEAQVTPYLAFNRFDSFRGRTGFNFQLNLTF